MKKSEQNLRDLWDTMKYANTTLCESQKRKEKGEKTIRRNNVKHPKFDEVHKSTSPRIHKFYDSKKPNEFKVG